MFVKNELDELSQKNLQRQLELFSGLIVARYCAKHDPLDKFSFEIINQIPGLPFKSSVTTFEDAGTMELKHIITGLRDSKELEGSMTYFVDNRKIYEVVDGQITCDTLNLASCFQIPGEMEDIIKQNFHHFAGQYFYQDISKLQFLNARQEVGQVFESNKYLFYRRNGELAISSKNSGKEILNSFGLTKEATQEDISAMDKLAHGARVLRQDEEQQKPTVRFKL